MKGGGACTSGNKELQQGTLTARYAMFSIQCSIQYTVQCTLHGAVFDKIYASGVSMPHWVVTSQPVKTKLAKYSHVQQKPKFIIITILYFSLV